MENKKNVIVHISNITPEVQEALNEKYPDGFQHHVFKVTKPNKDFFYAITVDTQDTSYLIKVDVKIDTATNDKIDEQLFSHNDLMDSELKAADEEDEPKKKKHDEEEFF